MMTFKIKESFEWMAPEFKIVDSGKNTIRIKGVALRDNVVSRNNRKYTKEELTKAARTWIGKPVTINHDMSNKAGTIIWMEYEKGALEYLADIKKNPYVRMIRDGSTSIRGVSVEANYLHNRCPKCGEKFWTEEAFHHHMHTEHFVKTNPQLEPHGLVGTALSLVLSPEEPGVAGTTIDIMEMYQKPVLRLLETVVTYRKEANKYLKKTRSKAVIQPESRQVFDKQLKEQEDPTKQGLEPATHSPEDGEADCGEGMHRDPETNQCVPDDVPTDQKTTSDPPETKSTTETVCPEGFMPDPDDPQSETCILKPLPQSDPPTDAPKIVPEPIITIPKVDVTTPAPAGSATASETVADTENPLVPDLAHGLEPTPHPAPDDKPVCLQGTHWDAEINTCVPDEVAEAPATTAPTDIIPKVTVETLPAMLKLGEPFANYDDHADCVAKNPDKEDPDAWCADAKRKAEGEPASEIKESLNIYEMQKAIRETLAKLDTKTYVHDVKQAETLNKINVAVAKVVTDARHTKTSITKLVKAVLSEAKLRHAYDRGTVKLIFDKLSKVSMADIARAKALRETQKQLVEAQKTAMAQINKEFASCKKALGTLATETAKSKKRVTEQKKDYEKILTIADKNILERDTKIKSLEDWKKTKEQDDAEKPEPCPEGQHRNEAGDCVPDEKTEETKKLEEMAVDIDNLKAKLKGTFKGVNKPLKETAQGTYFKDPQKTKPKKRK